MPKRQESALLVDTMIEEETRRKKQRLQNTHDSFARNINRLAVQEGDLQHQVQNLQWKKRTLEKETLALEVEQARVRKKAGASTTLPVQSRQDLPSDEVMHRSFPSPSLSTGSTSYQCLDSPPSTPRQPICPLPLPSQYQPFFGKSRHFNQHSSFTATEQTSTANTTKTAESITFPRTLYTLPLKCSSTTVYTFVHPNTYSTDNSYSTGPHSRKQSNQDFRSSLRRVLEKI